MSIVRAALKSLVVLAIVAFVAAGCSAAASGDEDEAPAQEPEPPKFDPADFVDPTLSTNPYHPTRPGLQWVRGGTTEVGLRKVPQQVISTMTDVIRIIDGVPCIAMLDHSTESGEISQVGFDYLALDKKGNVWLMGGYAEEFEAGEFTTPETAWLGMGGGVHPLHQRSTEPQRTSITGILIPGLVTMDTPRWYISTSGDEAPSGAEPYAIDEEVTVAYGTFRHVVTVLEGPLNAIDNELKYYAPGVGVVLNTPLDQSIHQDHFELANFIKLSPQGLAEASQVVLDLEEHARTTAPEVFGSVPRAKRALR
jgi:hypothetical protein